MAAEIQSAESSEQVVIPSRRKESMSELFLPNDTLDQPCDVVLMVKDGKQFKAHRRVLSEASPVFEKMLNSDMKETQEGVVRLEVFTESVMAATLQFIYTGDVQILAEDHGRELIVLADYLFLDKLKRLAGGILVQTLDTSNCFSTYYFAERYQCEDLLSNTRKFFLANFTSIYVASREDVLNMLRREVEMWISSDEIDVSAEEDVFKIILEWIDHDRSRRKRYFVELFRHVRLVYVSRDFLQHNIVTNELVKDNSSCLTVVKDAINLLDSKNFESLSVPPRKSLKTPAVVVNVGENILCYFPRENSWCKIGEIPAELITDYKFVPGDGQLYRTVQNINGFQSLALKRSTYNLYSNKCVRLPTSEEPRRYLRQVFVRNGDELCAVMSEPCVMDHLFHWRILANGRRICWRLRLRSDFTGTEAGQKCGSRKHTSFLTKYKPKSKSWEDISSFDHFDFRQDFCIVAKDNFVYFIGGTDWPGNEGRLLSNVDRYDHSKKQWDKLADIQMARKMAHGVAENEKIYIAGGLCQWTKQVPESDQYEVYDETTNEWQFIASFKTRLGRFQALLAVDGELYASSIIVDHQSVTFNVRIECFKPEENKWDTITEVAAARATMVSCPPASVWSMGIFKGFLNIRQVLEAFPSDGNLPEAGTTQPSLTSKKRERKCFIM